MLAGKFLGWMACRPPHSRTFFKLFEVRYGNAQKEYNPPKKLQTITPVRKHDKPENVFFSAPLKCYIGFFIFVVFGQQQLHQFMQSERTDPDWSVGGFVSAGQLFLP